MSLSEFGSPPRAGSSATRNTACLGCKTRKLKCDLKERPRGLPPCERCVKHQTKCIPPTSEEYNLRSENENLAQQLGRAGDEPEQTHLENVALRNNQASGNQPATSQSHDDEMRDVDSHQPSTEQGSQTGSPAAGRHGEERPEIFGNGSAQSWYHLLNNAGPDGRFRGHVSLASQGLDRSTPLVSLRSLPPRQRVAPDHIKIPYPNRIRYLFDEYYKYLGTIFDFTGPQGFDGLLESGYSRPLDVNTPESCLAHAKLLVIMAFGQLYSSNQLCEDGNIPGFQFFAAALQLLPGTHECPSNAHVETLCLIAYFMQNLNCQAEAFTFVGSALSMAMSLRLHQKEPGPPGEHDRRLWWSVCSLHLILAIKQGRAPMIRYGDFSVAMPSRLPSEKEYCPAVVLTYYTELSGILGEIHQSIYQPGLSTSQFQISMHRIVKDPMSWWDKIPEQLKFGHGRLNSSRERVSTLLHFCKCMNMTVQPFLYTVLRQRPQGLAEDRERDWREGLEDNTKYAVTLCIATAMDTVSLMKSASKDGLVANFGYMDTEHAYSAALTLLMVCAAFPSDPDNKNHQDSLESAFELLCSMSVHGNNLVGTRYDDLHQLAAQIAPGLMPTSTGANGSGSLGPNDGIAAPSLSQYQSVPEHDLHMDQNEFPSQPAFSSPYALMQLWNTDGTASTASATNQVFLANLVNGYPWT